MEEMRALFKPDSQTSWKLFQLRVHLPRGDLMEQCVRGEVLRVEIPKVLTDALSKTIKLGLPRGIVLRNENYYGKTRPRKR